MNIGEQLKKFRTRRGWTQGQLAECARTSISFISDIERGKSQPSLEMFIELARALDVDLDTLAGVAKPLSRDDLGRTVREAWVDYCTETGVTKPSHLAPWDALGDWDKEVDRRIGEAILRRWKGLR